MEKTGITLHPAKSATDWTERFSLSTITQRLSRWSYFERLASLYSALLDDRVSSLQAVYYFYAVITGTATLAPITFDLGWRALWFTLFCMAVKRATGKDDDTDRHQTK